MSKMNVHADAKDHTGKDFSSDLETLQHDFTELRGDVTKLLNHVVGTAKSGAGAVKHRAASAIDDLKDRGAEQPILSAFIVFGVGFVIAKLLSRK
jgi:hypothetical protein